MGLLYDKILSLYSCFVFIYFYFIVFNNLSQEIRAWYIGIHIKTI